MRASKARILILLACLTPAVALACCKYLSQLPSFPSGDPVASLPRQPGWQASPDNPIIRFGDFRKNGAWNDPCVLKEGDGYVMYLSSSTPELFKPPVLPFRAVSDDGIAWALDPKGPLLGPKGMPYMSLETPSVVRYKGIYHLYYSGIFPEGSVPRMAIGHATSPDGIKWTHDPDRTAVVSATGDVQDWNGYLVAEPGAIVYEGRIYLYFTAMGGREGGRPPQKQVIALATSTDGSRFVTPRIVLEQSELYPATKGFVGYSTPAATVHEGRVHLFCDVAYFKKSDKPQWSQVALHHAVSDDGENDFREDQAPIFTRRDFEWAAGQILAPTALFDGGTVKLWFHGHARPGAFMAKAIATGKTRKFGIGYATMDASRYDEDGLPAAPRPSARRPGRSAPGE